MPGTGSSTHEMSITTTGPGNDPIMIIYVILCNPHHDPPNPHFTEEDTKVQRGLVTYPRFNSEHEAETGGKHRQSAAHSAVTLLPLSQGLC